MSIKRQAYVGAIWLGIFRTVSQIFSWGSTILIAYLLDPKDYGLMAMATILTGYVALFNELGLGSAIIHRQNIKPEELSSLFWFMLFWGLLLAATCIVLAYPMQLLFGETTIYPITQSMALLFILSAFIVVPYNLIQKELKFKALGLIEAVSTIAACLAMMAIAWLGGGVWTLVAGHFVRQILQTAIFLILMRWRPSWHFKFRELKPFLNFGLKIAGARSLFYIVSNADTFFGGRALGAHILGFYTLALQLASIPNSRIIALINNVSFPVFSRFQDNAAEFNDFFLKLVRLISMITLPLYIGGFLVGDELLLFVLGAKWEASIIPFKLLCLTQLVIALTTPNSIANNALGRTHLSLYSGIFSAIVMPAAFFICARHGLNALVLPWITITPITRAVATLVTLRLLKIPLRTYLKNLFHPVLATLTMAAFILLADTFILNRSFEMFARIRSYLFIATIAVGALTYMGYLATFQRSLLSLLLKFRKGRPEAA